MRLLVVAQSRTESVRLAAVAAVLEDRGLDVVKIVAPWQSTGDGAEGDGWQRRRSLGWWRVFRQHSFDTIVVANGNSALYHLLARTTGAKIFVVQEAPNRLDGAISRRERFAWRRRAKSILDYVGLAISLGAAPSHRDFAARTDYYGLPAATFLVMNETVAGTLSGRGITARACGYPKSLAASRKLVRFNEGPVLVIGTPTPADPPTSHADFFNSVTTALEMAQLDYLVLPHLRHESPEKYDALVHDAERVLRVAPAIEMPVSAVVGASSSMLLEARLCGVPAVSLRWGAAATQLFTLYGADFGVVEFDARDPAWPSRLGRAPSEGKQLPLNGDEFVADVIQETRCIPDSAG